MISKLRRFSFGLFILLILVITLAGCLSKYKWREVLLADGHVYASFPDRVITKSYPVTLCGYELNFSRSATEILGNLFTIGYAPLSPELLQDHIARLELGRALMRNLYSNLQVIPPDYFEDYGQDIKIYGKPGKDQNWLMARIWVTDTILIEAVASGNTKNLSLGQAERFLHSVMVKR